MSALLALSASLLWGCSDFLGGTASRSRSPLTVIAWSDALVVVPLVLLAVGTGTWRLDGALVGWGAAAGITGLLGVTAFYRAMSLGAMGVVSPIAGLGVIVPVLLGIGLGERPSAAQVAGMVVGLAGVVLVSGGHSEGSGGTNVLLLAGLAGLGFGCCFVCIDRSEPHGTLMTLIIMRLATLVVLTLGWVASRRRLGSGLGVGAGVGAKAVPLLAAIGVLDAAANGCFARATGVGALAVVSVLSSLYPAVTALLARLVHDERLGRRQLTGVIATIAAVVLLASGPSG